MCKRWVCVKKIKSKKIFEKVKVNREMKFNDERIQILNVRYSIWLCEE